MLTRLVKSLKFFENVHGVRRGSLRKILLSFHARTMAYRNEEHALRDRRENVLLRVREAQREERSAQEAKASADEEARVDEKLAS